MSKQDEGVKAQHGEKMVAVTCYFWTNNIASVEGNIIPKQCHSSGIVMVNANKSHGIASSQRRHMFRSLEELSDVMKKALDESGVKRVNA